MAIVKSRQGKQNRWQACVGLMLVMLLSGCVTVTESRYTNKKSPEKSLENYTQLGLGYLKQGRPGWARQRLQKALQIDDNYPPANHAMGLVWQYEGEFALAEQHLVKALKYDKNFTMAKHHLGRLHAQQGKYQEAEQFFRQATSDRFYEQRPSAFNDRALNAFRVGNIAAATENYTEALRISPYNVDALINSSMVLLAQQELLPAFGYYERFLRLVDRRQTLHTAHSLWLGIRLADSLDKAVLREQLAAELQQSFSMSAEYQKYLSTLGQSSTGQ